MVANNWFNFSLKKYFNTIRIGLGSWHKEFHKDFNHGWSALKYVCGNYGFDEVEIKGKSLNIFQSGFQTFTALTAS